MLDTEIKVYPTTGGGFTVVYTDPFTKRRIRNRFNTKAEADAHESALSNKLDQALKDNPEAMFVSDLLVSFLRDRPTSDFTRARKLFVDFSDTFGHLRLNDVTTDAIRSWIGQLQAENGYRESTLFGIRVKVNMFYRYLIEKGVLEVSPTEGIVYNNRGPETTHKRILLSEDEIKVLVAKAKDYSPGYFHPIFLTFVETAAKTDEIIELRWESVDLKKRTITFPTATALDGRTIPISEELSNCLGKNKCTSDVVFTNIADRKFAKKQLTILLLNFKRSCGIKAGWMYLDIRHSFARNFLARGGYPSDLKTILGHRSIYTTLDVYGQYRRTRLEIGSPFES